MNTPLFIGLDAGRAALKAVARHAGGELRHMMPTAVLPGRLPSYEGAAHGSANDTVELEDGVFYLVGHTAQVEQAIGDPIGAHDLWIVDDTHSALLLGLSQHLIQDGLATQGEAVVALGVPSRVYVSQKPFVDQMCRRIQPVLSRLGFSKLSVLAYPQPWGAFASYAFNDSGAPRVALQDKNIGVIDIGQRTTDFCSVYSGSPVVSTTKSCKGMYLLEEDVLRALRKRSLEVPPHAVRIAIARGYVEVRGQYHDISEDRGRSIEKTFMPELMRGIEQAFPGKTLAALDTLLVAGGGAPLAFAPLKDKTSTSHAQLVDDPQYAIADGLSKLAAMHWHEQHEV